MKLKRSVLILFIAALFALSGCAGKKLPSVGNASFDSGSDSWETVSYLEAGAEAKTVETGGDHGGAAYVGASSENDVRFVQEVSVSPNTAYRISCDVKTEGVSGGAGANIGVYGVAVCGGKTFGDTDWHRIEFVGKTAEGQRKLKLSVGVGSHGALSTGKAWFDNVTVELADSATTLLGKANTNSNSNSEAPTAFPTGGIVTATAAASLFLLFFVLLYRFSAKRPLKKKVRNEKDRAALGVILILLAALAVRVALSFIFYGHKTDISCFTAWGRRMLELGPAHFYDEWCDYPPGYMLVLGFLAWVNRVVGGNADVYALIVKLPCIIADLACAYIIYRLAKKRMNHGAALLLMTVVAFTPVMAYVSSAWGQIDQLLALLIILPIILLYRRRPILAGLLFGLSIAVKPQALMCGPMFAAACAVYIVKCVPDNDVKPHGLAKLFGNDRQTPPVRALEVAAAVAGAFAVVILIALPFWVVQEEGIVWLFKKYFDTATSYKYATVNAYNFWALIGANWKSVDTPFLGLTYGKWGVAAMAFFVISGIGLYLFAAFRHNNPKGALPLSMAYTLVGIFTFGHYMHERYVFPALMLIMLAYLFYNDRFLLWSYFAYSVTLLLNCICAFYYSKLHEFGLYWDTRLVFICSLANVILFCAFTVLTVLLIVRNKPKLGYNG